MKGKVEFLIFCSKNVHSSYEKHEKNVFGSYTCKSFVIHSTIFILHFFTKNLVMSDPCFDARDCLLPWLLSLACLAVL